MWLFFFFQMNKRKNVRTRRNRCRKNGSHSNNPSPSSVDVWAPVNAGRRAKFFSHLCVCVCASLFITQKRRSISNVTFALLNRKLCVVGLRTCLVLSTRWDVFAFSFSSSGIELILEIPTWAWNACNYVWHYRSRHWTTHLEVLENREQVPSRWFCAQL